MKIPDLMRLSQPWRKPEHLPFWILLALCLLSLGSRLWLML